MRIGYFCDGPWAYEAFKRITSDKNLEICFVTVQYEKQDSTLISLAKDQGIPIELSENINSDDFLERIDKYAVDLFVSM